jgi:hypothetical protein
VPCELRDLAVGSSADSSWRFVGRVKSTVFLCENWEWQKEWACIVLAFLDPRLTSGLDDEYTITPWIGQTVPPCV